MVETCVTPLTTKMLGNAWLLDKKFFWRRKMCGAVQCASYNWSHAIVGLNANDPALSSSIVITLSLIFFYVLFYSLSLKVDFLRSRWTPVMLSWSRMDISLCHSFYVYVLCGRRFSWLPTLLRQHGRSVDGVRHLLCPVPFQPMGARKMQQEQCSHLQTAGPQ